MKCDICHENEATIHIQQTNGQQIKNLRICERCASERGISQNNPGIDKILSGLFSNLMNPEVAPFLHQENKILVCPNCGSDVSILNKKSKAGCAYCYVYLQKELGIEKFENSYKGKIPEHLEELKTVIYEIPKLKKELQAAVESENFEKAYVIKNRLDLLRGVKND